MVSIHVDIEKLEWRPGSAKYGPVAVHEGKEIIQSAILSDRRQEGGGLALLSRVAPPPGKVAKIVSVACSDEHVFHLEGGRGTKCGQPVRAESDYMLKHERAGAQRFYRNRDAEPCHLSRRIGREHILRGCGCDPGFGGALRSVRSILAADEVVRRIAAECAFVGAR